MKRTSVAVILIFCLSGTPVPAKANNGMTDMMRIMMDMFLWMMGGGTGGLNSYRNPYNLGGIGNPLLTGTMLGNPLLGSASGWGAGLPYNSLGMYSSPAYSGFSPYGGSYANPYTNLYGIPYSSPYSSGFYGNRPYSSQGYYNPYYPNYYNTRPPYGSPYRTGPYWRPGEYSRYGTRAPSSGNKAPVVIQPIIVSPEQQQATDQQQQGESKPKISVEVLPPVTSSPMAVEPVAPDYSYNGRVWDYDNPLYGHWQGINGEYLEFGNDRFRLRSIDDELQGTYEVKNSIIKAVIADRAEPVYMQYRLADGYLMFRSEDGQAMLFRRLP